MQEGCGCSSYNKEKSWIGWKRAIVGRLLITCIWWASPQFLGLLRNRMSQGLADTIKAESDKDLTHERTDDLARHLQTVF
jgi:protein required for attachment to host cells